jgi:hypothetical protein
MEYIDRPSIHDVDIENVITGHDPASRYESVGYSELQDSGSSSNHSRPIDRKNTSTLEELHNSRETQQNAGSRDTGEWTSPTNDMLDTGLHSFNKVHKNTLGKTDCGLDTTATMNTKEAGLSDRYVGGKTPQIGQAKQNEVHVVRDTVDRHGKPNDSRKKGFGDISQYSEANVIHLEMKGVKFTTLIDTGGSISLISKALLKQWDPTFAVSKLETGTATRIQSISNHYIPLLGIVTIKLHLGEFKIEFPFYVCDHIDMEMVWGADFLEYAGARIDYAQMKLILGPTLDLPIERIRVHPVGPGSTPPDRESSQSSQSGACKEECQMTNRSIDTDMRHDSDDIGICDSGRENRPTTNTLGENTMSYGDARPQIDKGDRLEDRTNTVDAGIEQKEKDSYARSDGDTNPVTRPRGEVDAVDPPAVNGQRIQEIKDPPHSRLGVDTLTKQVDKDSASDDWAPPILASIASLVEAQVGDRTYQVLIDSGAQISIIDENTVRADKILSQLRVDKGTFSQAAAVTGDKIDLRGCVNIPLLMRATVVTVQCYIVPSTGARSQIILGRNFLNEYKVSLNFANATMQIPEEPAIPLMGSISLDQSTPIILDVTLQVQPRSAILVLIPVHKSVVEGYEGLAQESPTLTFRHKVLVADGLVKIDKGKIPIKIINPQHNSVELKVGTEIGILGPRPMIRGFGVVTEGDELLEAQDLYHPITYPGPTLPKQTVMEVIDLTKADITDAQLPWNFQT